MRTKTATILAAALYFGTATLQAQNCANSGGNICSPQCHIFTQDCYDFADLDPNGYWSATAVYPECSSTCTGHAIGINYCGEPYGCGNEQVISKEQAQILHRAAPGAPLFTPSCSGGLVQAGIPRRRSAINTMPPFRRDRQLFTGQLLKEE